MRRLLLSIGLLAAFCGFANAQTTGGPAAAPVIQPGNHQPVAPAAGAAGQSDVAASSAAPVSRADRATKQQSAIPAGKPGQKAPTQGSKPKSFNAPIKAD